MQLKDNARYNQVYGKTLIGFNLIDAEERSSHDGGQFQSHNPSCQQDCIGTFPKSTRADLEAAISAADMAFEAWIQVPKLTRIEMIGCLGRLLEQYKEVLAKLTARELGQAYKDSLGEVQSLIKLVAFFQSEKYRSALVLSEDVCEPLGVTVLMTASYPSFVACFWQMIQALLCGCTLVWMPSEETSTRAYVFGKLLEMSGFPKGVVNIIHGSENGSADLLEHIEQGRGRQGSQQAIQQVCFSGSKTLGHKLREVCRQYSIGFSLALKKKQCPYCYGRC